MTTIAEFRKFGKEMIDYVADYMETLVERRVTSTVQPGYIKTLIPEEAPEIPEQWQDVMKDIEKVIMPGVTHWHHPHFHAYFAPGYSYPSLVADILIDGIGCNGFSWISSPACTELEMVMMDWLGKLLKLPEHFLFSSNGSGGGVIQSTTSEATLISLLVARSRHIKKNLESIENMGKLVIYASNEAHSSVERAAFLAGVKIHFLDTDQNFSLRGDTLEKAIEEDKAKGLIPFFITATLGTTTSCAFDELKEIGPVCEKENIWLHIDAAYAGSAFVCEEYRYLLEGAEYADSYSFNLHKWMLVDFDCCAMWVKNVAEFTDAFNVDPVYLQHQHQGDVADYRHWQIPLGRRFRSLKIWFVLRLFGKSGLQSYIRKHIQLAHEFEALINKDDRFELSAPVIMGLVCFRLKGTNELNQRLIKNINDDGKIFMTQAKLNEKFILRFAITGVPGKLEDITFAFKNIVEQANNILQHV